MKPENKEILDKIAILNGTGATQEKANKSDFDLHLADNAKQFAELKQHTIIKSNKDANDIYTIITLKREDESIYMKSALSGGISPNYTTRTETYYKADGTTIDKTVVYAITYDSNGMVVSEVMN